MFRHFGQASLNLLTSGDPPAAGYQSTGITDARHFAQTVNLFLRLCFHHIHLLFSERGIKPHFQITNFNNPMLLYLPMI